MAVHGQGGKAVRCVYDWDRRLFSNMDCRVEPVTYTDVLLETSGFSLIFIDTRM